MAKFARQGGCAANPFPGQSAAGDQNAFDAALQVATCPNLVALPHASLTEWWVRRPHGLEQGWTLAAPPSEGPVRLRVALPQGRVLSVDADGLGATLQSAQGNPWRYSGLVAWDANHQPVTVELAAQGDDLVVMVDTAGATWPITVDPLLTKVDTLLDPTGADGDRFGVSVSGAGDVNGDGYCASEGDCNDIDASVYPGAHETPADGVDQDCNAVDACYTDADDDGHGVLPVIDGTSLDCWEDANAAVAATDCNDTDALIHPGATEQCDEVDHDCSGNADDVGEEASCGPTIIGFRPIWGCASPVAGSGWLGLLSLASLLLVGRRRGVRPRLG